MVAMLLYQIVVLLSLLLFLGILLRNMIDLPGMPEHCPEQGVLVSVLVPARNEALNIERCVRSLMRQEYAPFEILVLDDDSTDATPELLRRLVVESGGKVRIVQGEALPDGWHGKSWACSQLGHQAKGELLLFTDADTTHKPDALRRTVGAMQASGADMLSLMPHQELGSFWEKLVVPLVHVILMCYLPLRFVRTSRRAAFCFANGQFILFRRECYTRINGHAAVREAIVEDVWLCKSVKKAGGTVVAFNGSDIVSCRMYHNFREIWEGFSKNLFAALGYSTPGLFVLILMISALYLVPCLFFSYALIAGEFTVSLFWLPLMQMMVALLCRIFIARIFRQSLAMTLLHVFSQVVLLAIACNSFYAIKFGKGASWKGRNYNFS
ncbi:glycosyltransferase [Pelodictyon phaeoclathratiforme]|jgi:chlorobactene glucosyltransferase|uniref:Glycosyl transferase family 2 n=1 Tax=Pelodictyon phaeoclathratiforme (strain DSM 5477 / BU-1) TaxID=324925 RepID=B4SCC1_PELPB|nr:glycosyltransferase family 2 protein [Pelodictyon phaeoclathratiforme]ACF42701.1 glycosyl transferase family 2 [Pelodictyon phaeoclathratiforme BU-1]